MKSPFVRDAERYIAAEAYNVDDSYSNASRIMRGLLDEINALQAKLEEAERGS